MPQGASVEPLIDEIRQHLIDDDLPTAFEKLLAALDADADDERIQSVRAAVIPRNSAYNHLQRQQDQGVVTPDEVKADHAKIVVALTNILDDLPDILHPPPPSVPVPDRPRLEKILGYNNLLEIAWLERGLTAAKSVCRILHDSGDIARARAFSLQANLLMTNNHVIATANDAAKMVAEFNYQTDIHGALLPSARYKFDSAVFATNEQLDYTLIGLAAPPAAAPPLNTWGTLKLNPNADPGSRRASGHRAASGRHARAKSADGQPGGAGIGNTGSSTPPTPCPVRADRRFSTRIRR